jgi:GYF domain 2
MQIFLLQNEQQVGPYSVEEIRGMLAARSIAQTDYGWHEGMTAWQPLENFLPTPSKVAIPLADRTRYHYADAFNEVKGPHPTEELQRLQTAGILSPSSLVCAEGQQKWVELRTVLPSKISAQAVASPTPNIRPAAVGVKPVQRASLASRQAQQGNAMHCGHCASEVQPQAIACMACGCAPKAGRRYCQSCASEFTNPHSIICVKCGSPTSQSGGKVTAMSTGEAVLWALVCFPVGYYKLNQTLKWAIWLGASIFTGGFALFPMLIDYFLCNAKAQKTGTVGEMEWFPKS